MKTWLSKLRIVRYRDHRSSATRIKMQKNIRNGERGFSLLEINIAMVVMMIAFLGISPLLVYSTVYNSGANDRAQAIAVAQQRMETLRNLPFNDAALTATTGTSVNITSAGRSYTVVTTITDSTPTLKTIVIDVRPTAGTAPAWARLPVTLTALRTSTSIGTNIQ